MEGKVVRSPFTAVIMGVLTLGLFVAQTDAKICCATTLGRNCYNSCSPKPSCGVFCNCFNFSFAVCPPSHPYSDTLENYVDVIEEVTTGTDPYPTFVECPSPDAKACFSRCRLTQRACVKECGCQFIYPPRP